MTARRKFIFPIIGLLAMGGILLVIYIAQLDRSINEILRYVEHRLSGHSKLEFLASPAIAAIRNSVERPAGTDLPTLGKGQRLFSLPPQHYDSSGIPKDSTLINSKIQAPTLPTILVANENNLYRALRDVQPGEIIEMSPGSYPMKGNFRTTVAGTVSKPITLRAQLPGTVTLELNSTAGFNISEPYWIVENIAFKGTCKEDSQCEHALHIVGKAKGTVIRNNHFEDFNAHIKVNGFQGEWPDYGLIQHNTFTNSHPRATNNPVTPIDIVGANGWRVTDSVIKNFVKAGGNQISFGAFMKGAGTHGHFERNLVVCTENDISRPGARVALSLGGGGTNLSVCRDHRCLTEHSEGAIINNVIAHCNDVAIYINKSNQSLVAHNTLINTAGVDVRFPVSSAEVYGNLLEGTARIRDHAVMDSRNNLSTTLSSIFSAPDQLGLEWRKLPALIPSHPAVTDDFCQQPRSEKSFPGALGSNANCLTTR